MMRVSEQRTLPWVGILMAFAAAIGTLSAFVWAFVTRLPSYVIRNDFTAEMSERGYSEIVGADARFSLIGFFVGLGLGWIAWMWFRRWGWPVVAVSVVASQIAGLVCLGVGRFVGGGSFEERMAQAGPGAEVTVSLEIHTLVPLALWALAAVLPTLLAASLGPELDSAGSERAAVLEGGTLTWNLNRPSARYRRRPPSSKPRGRRARG